MATYSIHPNSHRIDKTNFPTKDEAVARALECARILNRGVSVYEIQPPGTDTQKEDYPKVSRPITHIAFVLPDGTVQNGDHPAITLLSENPDDKTLDTFPYALGRLSKLVRTLDDVARHPTLPRDISEQAFSVADAVQNRIFDSQSAVTAAKVSENSSSFSDVFKPGTRFVNHATQSFLTIAAFDKQSSVVEFISGPQNSQSFRSDAATLAKTLLRSDFMPESAQPSAPTSNPSDANWNPETPINPVAVDPDKDREKLQEIDQESTLAERLGEWATDNEQEVLLAYCLSICDNDIYDADALATAFYDAFNPKSTTRRTTTAQLNVMRSFNGHILPTIPEHWFVSAQRVMLRELSNKKSELHVPPNNVRRLAVAALKMSQDKGIKIPKLAKVVAQKLARGQAFDRRSMEKMYLFFASREEMTGRNAVTAAANGMKPCSTLEYCAWGGIPALQWVFSTLSK